MSPGSLIISVTRLRGVAAVAPGAQLGQPDRPTDDGGRLEADEAPADHRDGGEEGEDKGGKGGCGAAGILAGGEANGGGDGARETAREAASTRLDVAVAVDLGGEGKEDKGLLGFGELHSCWSRGGSKVELKEKACGCRLRWMGRNGVW